MSYAHFLKTITPKSTKALREIIEKTIYDQGYNCNLNFIDTSLITNMSELLAGSKFNKDISNWGCFKC